MDLFEYSKGEYLKKAAPLAARMRPRNLDEFIGQEEVAGPGSLLRRSIEADQLSSLIFYGPPGSGKTTLALVLAQTTKAHFEQLSAVASGIADMKKVIQEAKSRLGMYGQKTLMFVDEIHRFNKAQQDALLPAVEEGTVVLVGATTENPYFEVNQALLSRSRIFALKSLGGEDLEKIIQASLRDEERGLGSYRVDLHQDALQHFVTMADGDARIALNALELAVMTTPLDQEGTRNITLEIAEQSIQRRAVKYDKTGDHHYDVVSAFIKSMRGSDPDASLHWLARMIDAGEDPEFIMRRILICASEDVGLADPHALIYVSAAAQTLSYIGMPEGRLTLASAALYVATAPKSNAVIKGIDQALEDVRTKMTGAVPVHLRDAHYQGAKKLGHGAGYLYPQSYPGNYVPQQYLPDALTGTIYYHPTGNGTEQKIKLHLEELRQNKLK